MELRIADTFDESRKSKGYTEAVVGQLVEPLPLKWEEAGFLIPGFLSAWPESWLAEMFSQCKIARAVSPAVVSAPH